MNYHKIVDVKPASLYGVIPQSREMTEGYNYLAENSVRNIPKNARIETTPNFDAIQLEYRAKLTDWISSINTISHSVFLICSLRLSEIILSHKIQREIQVFDAFVSWRKRRYDYTAIYSYNLGLDYVDFEKSNFATIDWIMSNKIDNLAIASKEAFLSEKEYYRSNLSTLKRYVAFSKLVTKQNIHYDIFRLQLDGGASGYYVSDRLKNAIEEAKCTGIAFTPVEELNWVKS